MFSDEPELPDSGGIRLAAQLTSYCFQEYENKAKVKRQKVKVERASNHFYKLRRKRSVILFLSLNFYLLPSQLPAAAADFHAVAGL